LEDNLSSEKRLILIRYLFKINIKFPTENGKRKMENEEIESFIFRFPLSPSLRAGFRFYLYSWCRNPKLSTSGSKLQFFAFFIDPAETFSSFRRI
jgi:hypothetical protein